ncbi:MAG: nitrite/sulfite reductase [Alphaproteobacteria bacterium]
MYRQTEYDRTLVTRKVGEFRAKVRRRLDGEPAGQVVRPSPTMNGVYLQCQAYMLRVAIPYGTLSSRQMRRLADVARHYDRGYLHVTTSQSVRFHWPKLRDVPSIVRDLAAVELHVLTPGASGVRTLTTDPFAGVAEGEVEDPRIYCEIIQQWAQAHPDLAHVTQGLAIAVAGSHDDRALSRFHDLGFIARRNADGLIGFEVLAGGSHGRTPSVGVTIRPFLQEADLPSYLEAIVRVCDRHVGGDGRPEHRLAVVIRDVGVAGFIRQVEAEWPRCHDRDSLLCTTDIDLIAREFALPYPVTPDAPVPGLRDAVARDPAFGHWLATCALAHRDPGRAIVVVSLKTAGGVPGNIGWEQMDLLAGLADRFSQGEIRLTHDQNVAFPHVLAANLHALWLALIQIELATPNVGLVSDIVSCPGLDYCPLATTRTMPLAQTISRRLDDLQRQRHIGPLGITISGCAGGCGRHCAGAIGLLGVERAGEDHFQILLGGNSGVDAALGEPIGPPLPRARVVDAVERIIETYVGRRLRDEGFLDTWRRLGPEPFRAAIMASDGAAPNGQGA